MRKLFFLLFTALPSSSFAQVAFQNISFSNALAKARAEGKIILLQFEAADCEQCNDVANKGFENKELTAKTEQGFVCLKIDSAHQDRATIATTYNLLPQKSFGTLFLDGNGTLLHSFLKTTTFSKDYITQMEKAFEKAGEVLNIRELENEYRNGNKSFGFLQLLLQKRKAVHMPTGALLDEYVDALPPDSLQSIGTLTFLAQMAPMLDSKADRAMRANMPLFNRAWYGMPLAERISINNTIIYNGMEKAIKEKDEKLAVRTASFAQGTNNTNPAAGAKAFDTNMLRYYDEVKDTTAYFRKSIAYYERYFLSVSPDSIKRTDSANMKRMMQAAKKDTVREGGKVRVSSTVAFAPLVQRFSSELNNGAYNFYLRTGNPYLLSIATEWAKRALEFYESPETLDTYAKLLYKQNQKTEAIEEMTKAVDLQKRRGFPAKNYEATLAKMNTNAKLTN